MVYANLAAIPGAIDMIDIFRNAEAAEAAIVDEVLALPVRPQVIWMQLQVRNDAAAAKAEDAGLRVVMNRCPKMEYGKTSSAEWGWVEVTRVSFPPGASSCTRMAGCRVGLGAKAK